MAPHLELAFEIFDLLIGLLQFIFQFLKIFLRLLGESIADFFRQWLRNFFLLSFQPLQNMDSCLELKNFSTHTVESG